MIELYIIGYLIFWIVYYSIEGYHDANVILWQQTTQSKTLTVEEQQTALKYNKKWHEIDSYEKAITHLAISIPVLFLGGTIFLAISILFMSLAVRWLVHDAVVNKELGIDVNHIGVVSGVDIWLKKMCDKGISQWTIKGGLLAISIILTVILLCI